MKEYIEREAALKAMSQAIQDRTWSMDDFDVMIKMEDYVAELPAADVVPVVHGEWIVTEYPNHLDVKCSACKTSFYVHKKGQYRIDHSNHCPNCGAKMDGGKSND